MYCPVYFAESDVASFDGASYMFFKLDAVTSPSPKDLLTMNFKTLHNSGVVMHMEGNHGHTLTLELLKGKLFIRLRKGTLVSPSLCGYSLKVLLCMSLWNVPGDCSRLSAILMALRHSCLVCVLCKRKSFQALSAIQASALPLRMPSACARSLRGLCQLHGVTAAFCCAQ